MECEPTSERVIDDIKTFEDIVRKVHDAEGVIVCGLALRSGRRYKRVDGKGFLKRKSEKSQRKSTLQGRPVHNDAWTRRGYNSLTSDDDVDEIFDEIVDAYVDFGNEANEVFGYLEGADVNGDLAMENEEI